MREQNIFSNGGTNRWPALAVFTKGAAADNVTRFQTSDHCLFGILYQLA